jgi:UDP-N-acetylenolpyruvoylglucosamine reductase
MERDPQGNIIGKTVAGRYMVQVGFEFDKRPMREIYKAMQLIDKKQQLRKKCKSPDVGGFYHECIFGTFRRISGCIYLFYKG